MSDEELPSYTPQPISDILPIYRPQDSDSHIQTYVLRQVSSNNQYMSLKDNGDTASRYTIKAFVTGGFMNKKPHIIISKNDNQNEEQRRASEYPATDSNNLNTSNSPSPNHNCDRRPSRRFSVLLQRDSDTHRSPNRREALNKPAKPRQIAAARFSILGTDTTIDYTDQCPPALLILESSHSQTLRTTINGLPHWWRPFPGNKSVLELLTSAEETVARFVYAAPAPMTTGPGTGRKKSVAAGVEVGELYVVVDALME